VAEFLPAVRQIVLIKQGIPKKEMPNVKSQMSTLNLPKKNSPKGYTLIEILVGLSILSLLFAIGYASYREFSRRQILIGTARTIRGDLRLAQELSLSGKKPGGCSVLDGYNFLVVPPTGYEIRALCGVTTYLEKGGSLVGQGVTLSNLSPDLTPSNTITFKTLGEGTNIPAGTSTTLTITQTTTGTTTDVVVTSGGEIK